MSHALNLDHFQCIYSENHLAIDKWCFMRGEMSSEAPPSKLGELINVLSNRPLLSS